jgi:hypothetical protein
LVSLLTVIGIERKSNFWMMRSFWKYENSILLLALQYTSNCRTSFHFSQTDAWDLILLHFKFYDLGHSPFMIVQTPTGLRKSFELLPDHYKLMHFVILCVVFYNS